MFYVQERAEKQKHKMKNLEGQRYVHYFLQLSFFHSKATIAKSLQNILFLLFLLVILFPPLVIFKIKLKSYIKITTKCYFENV